MIMINSIGKMLRNKWKPDMSTRRITEKQAHKFPTGHCKQLN